MKKFRLLHFLIALMTLTLFMTLAFRLLSRAQKKWTIKIATATPGGTYYPLGSQLAHIVKQLPPIRDASIWETSGAEENIRLLCNPAPEKEIASGREMARKDDRADLAFLPVTAFATASPDQREEIRAIAALYMDVVQVVARHHALYRMATRILFSNWISFRQPSNRVNFSSASRFSPSSSQIVSSSLSRSEIHFEYGHSARLAFSPEQGLWYGFTGVGFQE
jgi:hypothetical protein